MGRPLPVPHLRSQLVARIFPYSCTDECFTRTAVLFDKYNIFTKTVYISALTTGASDMNHDTQVLSYNIALMQR